MVELSDGTYADLLPVGTRVCSIRNPHLKGTIRAIEMHESGRPSAIPYNVRWDDNELASRLRGWFFIYGTPGDIEALAEVE